jgi:hypothetical protein
LEPLRQFARSRLEQRGEVSVTHEHHAAFFLELFERAEQEFLKQHATPSLVSRMDGELGNLRVALRWLIGEAKTERAQRLAGAARTLWMQRPYVAEGRRWLEETLALDATEGPPEDPAARARALLGLLGIAVHQGDYAVGEEAGLRALHLFEELQDTARAAGALGFLGQVTSARADLVRARRFMEGAAAATRETGQIAAFALMLSQLAEFDLEEGDLVAAQRHAEESLEAATAVSHAAARCRALVDVGEVHRRLGQPTTHRRFREEAVMLVRQSHPQESSVIPALITLGRQARESADARGCLVEGLLLARERSRRDLARGLEVVVEAAAADGQVGLALQLAGAAAALRDRMGTPPWPSESAMVDAATTCARQNLTADAADRAWLRGRTSPVDEALAMALHFLRHP